MKDGNMTIKDMTVPNRPREIVLEYLERTLENKIHLPIEEEVDYKQLFLQAADLLLEDIPTNSERYFKAIRQSPFFGQMYFPIAKEDI